VEERESGRKVRDRETETERPEVSPGMIDYNNDDPVLMYSLRLAKLEIPLQRTSVMAVLVPISLPPFHFIDCAHVVSRCGWRPLALECD
jgi:hypothetical protein